MKIKFLCRYGPTTELDRENPAFPPYLISHGQKIGSSRVLHSLRVADCMCATLQVWSTQCERNISALEVGQSNSVSLHTLLGKDLTQPNFYSIADAGIIRGRIGSPGSPYLCGSNQYIIPRWKNYKFVSHLQVILFEKTMFMLLIVL